MKVVVIGGGASGMFAAITAAQDLNEVVLIEKTNELGNKLKITGKGRCNLTFQGDFEKFEENILKNSKFVRSSFSKFSNESLTDYFSNLGIKLKEERGGRIFPVSDNAQDIIDALKQELKKNSVKIILGRKVVDILEENTAIKGIKLDDGNIINCDKCIIATGGMSYPKTGSTGDGYKFAKKLGHEVDNVVPGLVPFRCKDSICSSLQGLQLKNISIKIIENDCKILYNDFGELLFAHFGLTGPVILSASSAINRVSDLSKKFKDRKIVVSIDLKPALTNEMLYKRIGRDFEKYSNKEIKNSLNDLLPKRLIPVIIDKTDIDEYKKVNQITKIEKQRLVEKIKNLKIYIDELMPIDIAIISCGGVDVKQINPKTMESKIIKGLYFAGEVLDIDAFTGGYNLQIAFSTAYVAGKNY